MTTLNEVKNIMYDWCELVLNSGDFLPAVNAPLARSFSNEGVNEERHIVIGYTPGTWESRGLRPIELGVDSDFDFENPAVAPTYSTDTHITPIDATVEIREVNGDGSWLAILQKTISIPAVIALFNSHSMGLKGFAGPIQSIPYRQEGSYHEESILNAELSVMDSITFDQDFIASAQGSYFGTNSAGSTIISGTFSTDDVN
jgi:hypothetical protein